MLTLDLKDPKRLFETPPLIRRLKRFGLMTDEENSLDDILKLSTQRIMERRLQTKVFKQGLAKSIHHARVLIRQRHIRLLYAETPLLQEELRFLILFYFLFLFQGWKTSSQRSFLLGPNRL